MLTYHITPDAQSDLIEIRRYTVEQWGQAQSIKYLSELRQTMSLLAQSPALGTVRSDVGANIMSFPHASHIIYYVVHEKQVVVFGVLHKRMVPVDHLTERDL